VQKVNNAAARVSSSTSRLRARAGKVKNPKLRSKLISVANKLDSKAAGVRSQTSSKPPATRSIMGVDYSSIANMYVDPNKLLQAAINLIAQGSEADALDVAASINQLMSDDVDQLSALPATAQQIALISQATDIGNNSYDIVMNYDESVGDTSVPTRVAALQSRVNDWTRGSFEPYVRTNTPVAAPPPPTTPAPVDTGPGTFDPGSAGGGGAGSDGGFDSGSSDDWDTGQSSAVQAFRDQGIDPFEEDDGSLPVVPEGGEGDSGFDPTAFDDSMYDASGEGMSSLDAEKAALEEESSPEEQQMLAEGDDMLLEPESSLDAGREALDSVEGDFDWGTSWGQLFYNPAGIALDALNSPTRAQFQAHATTPTTTGRWRASKESQDKLTAAQQRLAQARAALAASRTANLQQLMVSTGDTAPLPSGALQVSTPLDRYSSSGAFVSPTGTTDWSAQQPVVPVDGGSMPTDSLLSPESVEGLTPEEVETVCCGVEAITGFPVSDELADIVVDSYEKQVTDARPEWTRGPAARHGGASYLDPGYPRGGSVAGRQGGLIQPEEKIIVGNKDVLFGGCYEHGLDVLGAGVNLAAKPLLKTGGAANAAASAGLQRLTTPRAGFVQQSTPKGRKFMSLKVMNPKHHDHTTSIRNARDAGKRAISVADKVDKQVKKTAIAIHKTAVKGDLIGASKAVARGVAHHLLTSAQLVKATKAARDLGQKAIKAADKHEKGIATLNAKNKTGAAAARTRLKMGSGGKATVIHGYDDEEVADSILGASLDVVFGTCTPDPNDPGWCTDGTVDPNYTGAGLPPGLPQDPNTIPTDGSAMPGPPDYGLGPAPTAQSVEPQAGIDYVADPFPGADGDVNQYSSDPSVPGTPLPIGAVIYDGSNPPAYLGLGSYTTFYGQLPGGAPAEGGAGPAMPPGGSYASGGSGYQWHDDGWYSFRKNDYAGPAGSGDQRLKNADDSSANTGPARASNSLRYNWGPMIGNPNGALRGLRYDVAGNQWFWYYDQAPKWAKAPIQQALINQAILDYQAQLAAAAADYAAAAAADRLAAEQAKQLMQQQALEDSEMQHQMELQQTQATQDASVQSMADDAAARQQAQQDESYARQAQAEAQAQAMLEQSQALTQAKIEQQELETLARLAAQEQAAQAVSDVQMPAADEGDSAYVPADEMVDEPLYDGYSDAKEQLDSEE